MDRFLSSSSSSFFFSFFLSISRGIVFVSFSFSLPLSLSLSYLRVVPQSPLEGTAGVVVLHAIGVEGLFVFFVFFNFHRFFFLSERRRKKKGFEGRKIVSSSFPSQIPPPFYLDLPVVPGDHQLDQDLALRRQQEPLELVGVLELEQGLFFFFGGGGSWRKKRFEKRSRSRKEATGRRGFLSFLNARPLLLPFLSFSLSLSLPPPVLLLFLLNRVGGKERSLIVPRG